MMNDPVPIPPQHKRHALAEEYHQTQFEYTIYYWLYRGGVFAIEGLKKSFLDRGITYRHISLDNVS